MKLREKIELEAKNTVGYSETENKNSFMVGVSVAFSKTEEHYKKEIESLERQLGFYQSMYEETVRDLKTFASIINRYSNMD